MNYEKTTFQKNNTKYGYPVPKILQTQKKFEDVAIGNGKDYKIEKKTVINNESKQTVCNQNNGYPCAFRYFH
jgi:hypothetical protein